MMYSIPRAYLGDAEDDAGLVGRSLAGMALQKPISVQGSRTKHVITHAAAGNELRVTEGVASEDSRTRCAIRRSTAKAVMTGQQKNAQLEGWKSYSVPGVQAMALAKSAETRKAAVKRILDRVGGWKYFRDQPAETRMNPLT